MAQGGPEAMGQNFVVETFDPNDTNKAIALLEENAFLMSNLMNLGLLVMRENPHFFSTPSSGDREFLGMSHYAVFPWESEVAEPIRTRMNLPEVQWFIALDFLLRYEEDRLKKKNNEEDLERYYLAPDPEHNSYYEIPVKGVVVVRVCILSDGTFRIETYDGKNAANVLRKMSTTNCS